MKMRCIVVVLMVMFSGLASLPARADGPGSGFYLLAGLGQSDIDLRLTTTDVIWDEDRAWDLGVGYAFNRYFSVEAAYQDFGSPYGYAGCPVDVFCIAIVPFSREKVDVDGFSAAFKGALPLGMDVSLLAKLGVLSWDSSARTAGLNDSGSDLLAGAGLAWRPRGRWEVEATYEDAGGDLSQYKLRVLLHL